ncbi:hypothetical protein RchiOBHm_Chr5g0009101 [Rosa chinensis]|uniref:Uncharacterized protein n=1 Tax=Rosa chinensis TaxID=74649 RepID=A0A2P6Q491_ROSCH|nr:hypothetical protein RchiOBHm_Chr5g0009101 [Rosa chinensis]
MMNVLPDSFGCSYVCFLVFVRVALKVGVAFSVGLLMLVGVAFDAGRSSFWWWQ